MLQRTKDSIRMLFLPIARNISISPNTITILGLGASVLAAAYFTCGKSITGGIFLLIGGAFDIVDGAVAKENNMVTRFGGFLDSVCDRFADSAVISGIMLGGFLVFPFIFLNNLGWFVGVLAIIGSLMVSYTRARAEAAGASASVGIAERAERMIIIAAGAFTGMVNYAVMIVAIMAFITVFQRIIFVRKMLGSS